jgi:hypothetical protein
LTGATGATGPKGDKGDKGDTGAPGTALAFANLNADGTVVAENSKAISTGNINHVATGVYCFSGLSFTPRNVVGNIDISGGGGAPGPYVHVDVGPASGCPAGTQFTVDTLNNNVFSDRPFYVMVN